MNSNSMNNSFFTKRMKMADVIAANHNLILVMPRLGIPLGFGEQSVQEVCDHYKMPVDFVLLIFNGLVIFAVVLEGIPTITYSTRHRFSILCLIL